jgi:hypothetical protein
MLVQRFAGAFCALLVASALGPGAAKPGAVGLGLFRRLISRGAFSMSIQVDGFPHDDHHQPKRRYGAANPTPCDRSRGDFINSACIRKIPHRNPAKIFARAKAADFCAALRQHTNSRARFSRDDLYQWSPNHALNKN